MIRLKHTVLLVSIAFAGACTATSTPAPTAMTDHGCPGSNPGIVPININYNAPTIVVAPNPQVAHVGNVLQFNLVGANDVWVSTSGKTPEAGWLNGSGRKKAGKPASQMFYICIPDDLVPPKSEKDFEYNVDAVGKPQLDPIVTVRNP